jgi:hypothetical protein
MKGDSPGALRGGLSAKLVDHGEVKGLVAAGMFELGGSNYKIFHTAILGVVVRRKL